MSTSSWECISFDGKRVPHGENFVPGPDYCTACKCEKGETRFCRAALCQPPQDCKSFRIGESCCDFHCLDKVLPTLNKDGTIIGSPDTGLRMVASAITAILSLALLLFLVYRLRQRKLRIAQHQYFEEQLDALGGYPNDYCRTNPCCRNAVYLTGNDHVDFFLDGHVPHFSPWKPPSYYFQPSEAPPPYSEVVASDRALADGSLPSLNPLMVQLNPLHDSQQPFESSGRNWVPVRNSESSGTLPVTREETGLLSTRTNSAVGSTLRSDETYEVSTPSDPSPIEGRRRPRSVHEPPKNSKENNRLNDLNKGTAGSVSSVDSERGEGIEGGERSAVSQVCEGNSCCGWPHNVEKCNVCSSPYRQSVLGEKNLGERSEANGSRENERRSALVNFDLHLKLDTSSSSTSTTEVVSQLSSLESHSSRSSEDTASPDCIPKATSC